jgi:hypothetical protein
MEKVFDKLNFMIDIQYNITPNFVWNIHICCIDAFSSKEKV